MNNLTSRTDWWIPGLVDLQVHPVLGGLHYGIFPDKQLLSHGVTSVLSQGDTGAENWTGYLDKMITADMPERDAFCCAPLRPADLTFLDKSTEIKPCLLPDVYGVARTIP